MANHPGVLRGELMIVLAMRLGSIDGRAALACESVDLVGSRPQVARVAAHSMDTRLATGTLGVFVMTDVIYSETVGHGSVGIDVGEDVSTPPYLPHDHLAIAGGGDDGELPGPACFGATGGVNIGPEMAAGVFDT